MKIFLVITSCFLASCSYVTKAEFDEFLKVNGQNTYVLTKAVRVLQTRELERSKIPVQVTEKSSPATSNKNVPINGIDKK